MVIAASALLAACGTEASGGGAPATNASTSPVTTGGATTTPIGGGEAPPGVTAEVVSVLDGDSMRVLVSGREDELRLLGINAPEPAECFADEARSLLAVAAGEPIVIVGDDRDQFGRIVGYAYRGATNLNQWMLAQGGAIAMSTDHELFSDFIAAEQDAVLRGVGLWAPGVCTVAGGSAVFIFEVEFDAPGRDDENPNAEFVVLGNDGEAVDLTGWILRDESSSHRYEFPNDTTIGSGAFLIIRSGCGADTIEELYWCEPGSVWNNTGDTAILVDESGAFVSRFRYHGD